MTGGSETHENGTTLQVTMATIGAGLSLLLGANAVLLANIATELGVYADVYETVATSMYIGVLLILAGLMLPALKYMFLEVRSKWGARGEGQ